MISRAADRAPDHERVEVAVVSFDGPVVLRINGIEREIRIGGTVTVLDGNGTLVVMDRIPDTPRVRLGIGGAVLAVRSELATEDYEAARQFELSRDYWHPVMESPS